MKTQCPNCKQHYEVDDSFLGATVSCETCKKEFVVENEETEINYLDNSSKTSKKAFVLMGLVFVLVLFVCVFFIAKLSNKVNVLTAQNTELQNEIKELKQKNSELKSEVDDLVFGPEAMLLNALAAYNTSDLDRANKIIVELFQKYPGKRMNKEYMDAFDKISLAFEDMQMKKRKEEEKRQAEKRREEEKRQADKEKKEAEMLAMIDKKYDIMQEITWYKTKRDCKYTLSRFKYVDASNKYYCVELYFGKKDNGLFLLRLESRFYDATDSHTWIFYEKVQLKGDNGVNVFVETKYPEKESEVGNGSITEWSDNYVGDMDNQFIKLAKANTIRVKFYGKYPYEFDMNEEQLNAFKDIISLYESMRQEEEE